MNPCSKRKTKSLSIKEIQKTTYTYDTCEDESEEEVSEDDGAATSLLDDKVMFSDNDI